MKTLNKGNVEQSVDCPTLYFKIFYFAAKSSILQQPSPVQRAFTFCTAAATRLPMGWSGTPTI